MAKRGTGMARSAIVLGGAGQIGVAAAARLLAAGWEVAVVSRATAPSRRSFSSSAPALSRPIAETNRLCGARWEPAPTPWWTSSPMTPKTVDNCC
ncbi:NAD-dependent epimerase/dehydratase family protein [Caulobacter soli]|uniref:NAD-dependent epimerase/dehydratase family protein n=1 Tax=Caulobacter soli TaxID=2708539 RepID=UPI003CCD5932